MCLDRGDARGAHLLPSGSSLPRSRCLQHPCLAVEPLPGSVANWGVMVALVVASLVAPVTPWV